MGSSGRSGPTSTRFLTLFENFGGEFVKFNPKIYNIYNEMTILTSLNFSFVETYRESFQTTIWRVSNCQQLPWRYNFDMGFLKLWPARSSTSNSKSRWWCTTPSSCFPPSVVPFIPSNERMNDLNCVHFLNLKYLNLFIVHETSRNKRSLSYRLTSRTKFHSRFWPFSLF